MVLTSWLQAGTADQESINIWLLSQVGRVLLGNAATIKNTSGIRGLFRDFLRQPFPNGRMDFLGLRSGGYLSSSNGPGHRQAMLMLSVTSTYQIGSYATTTLDQSLTMSATALSWVVTTSMVLPASRC